MKFTNKGQISLDLLFSLIIVLIFVTSMLIFVNDFKESKENISLENNLREKSIHLTSTINNAIIMKDTNFEIKQLITKINYKNELITPTITIDTNKLILEYENKKIISSFIENDLNITIDQEYLVINNE